MKLTLVAVGKVREDPTKWLFESYVKRIRNPFELVEVEQKNVSKGQGSRTREAQLLLSKVGRRGRLVALDERGKHYTSHQFSNQIKNWQNEGTSELTFLIGGADGLDQSVLSKAELVISFGRQTWPHLLVRVMLVEQLYRTQCILDGHPYHRG